MSKRDRRMKHRVDAAKFLETHTGPVMSVLAEVVQDLAEETDSMRQFEADFAMAMELGHRLDAAVAFSDPLVEALDGVVTSFVALIAVSIYRSACRAEKLRGARLERLRDRLRMRGPKMATFARKGLERRIKRLEAKV